MRAHRRLTLLFCLLGMLLARCGDEDAPPPILPGAPTALPVSGAGGTVAPGPPLGVWGAFRPAAGLQPADYEVFGLADDEPSAIRADGLFGIRLHGERARQVFAAPRPGTATFAHLAPETGIYISPHLGGGQRLVLTPAAQGGWSYALAVDGYLVIDSHTTVLALALLHPMLATGDPAIQQQQARWMVERLGRGWPSVSAAARAYDEALLARRDPADDPTFVAQLHAALAEIAAALPAPVATVTRADRPPRREGSARPRAARMTAVIAWPWSPAAPEPRLAAATYSVLDEVSYIDFKPLDEQTGEIIPRTRRGTALDYFYTVSQIDTARLKPDDKRLTNPGPLDQLPLVGRVGDGVVAANSYASYIDVAGKLADRLTTVAGERAGLLGGVKASKPNVYEVRLFSGGFSNFNNPLLYEHVRTQYAGEADIAFRQNMAMAVSELLSTFPGYDEILGDGLGQAIVKGAVESAISSVQSMGARRSLTGADIQGAIIAAAKAALDAALKEASRSSVRSATRGGWRMVARYLGSGAKKLFKVVLKFPAQVAKGGSLVNRAARMAAPESLMEYHVVHVGVSPCEQYVAENVDDPAEVEQARPCIECLDANCEPQCVARLEAAGVDAWHACVEGCLATDRACADQCKTGAPPGPLELCFAACDAGPQNDKGQLDLLRACYSRCDSRALKSGTQVCLDGCTAQFAQCEIGCDASYPAAKQAVEALTRCGDQACAGQCATDEE